MASTDKDLPLKLRVSAAFRKMGYVAFHEVDLSTYSYQAAYRRKQVTDFDVLAVRIENDLASQIAVAECKSSEDRAMENLLKLHGVKSLFGAERSYFVQQRIDVNAREVGSEMGVACLDAENLAALLASLEVSEEVEVRLEERVYTAKIQLAKQQKSDFPSQFEYLKFDFWTLPDHRNVINLVRLMGQLKKECNVQEISHIVLAHQLVAALALSVLRLAGAVVHHNISAFQETLLTVLLGGSRERRDREALHDAVAKIVPHGNLPLVPAYFPQLAELTKRYVNAAHHSHLVLACLDDMCRRVLLEAAPDAKRIPGNYSERTIKLSRDAIHFCVDVSGLPKDLFIASLTD